MVTVTPLKVEMTFGLLFLNQKITSNFKDIARRVKYTA